jgi:hypothetical protein
LINALYLADTPVATDFGLVRRWLPLAKLPDVIFVISAIRPSISNDSGEFNSDISDSFGAREEPLMLGYITPIGTLRKEQP